MVTALEAAVPMLWVVFGCEEDREGTFNSPWPILICAPSSGVGISREAVTT